MVKDAKRSTKPDDFLIPATSEVPSAAVETLLTEKKPPPESAGSIRIRTLVIASFWAVSILLGLPVWFWTTSIHRARLPLQEMLDWADGKVRGWLGTSGASQTDLTR